MTGCGCVGSICHAALPYRCALARPPRYMDSTSKSPPICTCSVHRGHDSAQPTGWWCIAVTALRLCWSASGQPHRRRGLPSKLHAVCVVLGCWRRSTLHFAVAPVVGLTCGVLPSNRLVGGGSSRF